LIAVLLAVVSAGCGTSQGSDVSADVPVEVFADVEPDVQTDAGDETGQPDLPDSSDDVPDSVDLVQDDAAFDADADVGDATENTVSFRQFDMMGREVAALGINMNFGPLLDTHYVIDNGNLNTRTFGPDTALNARLGLAAVYGFQRNLVLPTAKHFPGDGMAASLGVDSERLLGQDFAEIGRLALGASLTREGDVILIDTAGAYGRVMSSEYNSRPLAREVFLPIR